MVSASTARASRADRGGQLAAALTGIAGAALVAAIGLLQGRQHAVV
jgi:hypothetical protein